MISALKNKGFVYDANRDVLTGVFNGMQSIVFDVVENADKILQDNKKGKIIQQMDKEDNVLREFLSNTQICETFGILRTDNIDKVLKGRQKTAYGYYWRYKNEQ